jgi:hypothetical protein
MLGPESRTREEVDHCRAAMDEQLRLTVDDFERLSTAFFAELERRSR